jgi:hypothetical protein
MPLNRAEQQIEDLVIINGFIRLITILPAFIELFNQFKFCSIL